MPVSLGWAMTPRQRFKVEGKKLWRIVLGLPVHPILFGLYPVLALAHHNVQELEIGDIGRSVVLASLLALLTLSISRLLLGDWSAAGLLASSLPLLFFSYGHVYSVVRSIEIAGFLIGRHRYLLPTWLILGLGMWWVGSRRKSLAASATKLLNGISLLAILFPLYGGAMYLLETSDIGTPRRFDADEYPSAENLLSPEILPDVYYIVLDGYARQDKLADWFGYDNSGFLTEMTHRAFYVATESNSNYFGTAATLTSVLNMVFLQDLDVDIHQGIYPGNLRDSLHNSQVLAEFDRLGYAFVAFPTDYPETDFVTADYYLTPDTTRFDYFKESVRLNSFEVLLLRSTPLKALLDLDARRETAYVTFLEERFDEPRQYRRVLVLSAFEHLAKVPAIPGPKFVFAHIVSPHEPYIFHPDGSTIDERELAELSGSPLSDHHSLYLGQLEYISERLLETVDAILKGSDRPPIIVVQADHGPDLDLNWADPEPDKLRARMAILNAFYLPAACQSSLTPSISSINTFRVVLNCIDGGQRALLPDQSFYSNLRTRGDRLILIPVEELLD